MQLQDLRPGATFGPSQWVEVTQARVDAFADATDDHQWIHVDPERARSSQWGGTIAHGWLSLALVAPVVFDLLQFERTMLINYGAERVRFPAPLPAGACVRGRLTIGEITTVGGGTRIAVDATLEQDMSTDGKPVCVARILLQATESR